jgi:hypothetical protein
MSSNTFKIVARMTFSSNRKSQVSEATKFKPITLTAFPLKTEPSTPEERKSDESSPVER